MHPSLEHSGISLRPITPADRDALFLAARESIDTVGPWMSWCNADYSITDSDTWIALCQKNWQSGTDRDFGIFDADSGDLLGCIGINQINSVHNFGNLGYWVRAGRVNTGVATNAARLAAQFAFQALHLSRLEIVARVDNLASRRVAEKLGCHFECIARHRILFKGSSLDAALYSLLPNEIAG